MNYAKIILTVLVIFTFQSFIKAMCETLSVRSEKDETIIPSSKGWMISSETACFIKALEDGNIELITSFFTEGVDINQRTYFSPNPPLIQAIYSKNPKSVAYILSLGADVNVKNTGSKRTALMNAMEWELIDIGLLLLQQKDIALDAQDMFGSTALRRASTSPYVLVEKLIALGANIELADKEGETPLMGACLNGPSEEVAQFIRLLLLHGADISARNKNGRTPLSYVQTFRHSNIVAIFEAYRKKICEIITAAIEKNIKSPEKDVPINFDLIDVVEEYLFEPSDIEMPQTALQEEI